MERPGVPFDRFDSNLTGFDLQVIGKTRPTQVYVGKIASIVDLQQTCQAIGRLDAASLVVVLHCRWVSDLLNHRESTPSIEMRADTLRVVWIPDRYQDQQLAGDQLWWLFRAKRSNIYQICRDAPAALRKVIGELSIHESCVVLWPAECSGLDAWELIADAVRESAAPGTSVAASAPPPGRFSEMLSASQPIVKSPDKRARLVPLGALSERIQATAKSVN
ncbi:MAG: hypothetical protein K2Y37_18885 [Pirellulales bacterium]|nr:hypothetical protein [Pirellulales bacterium]